MCIKSNCTDKALWKCYTNDQFPLCYKKYQTFVLRSPKIKRLHVVSSRVLYFQLVFFCVIKITQIVRRPAPPPEPTLSNCSKLHSSFNAIFQLHRQLSILVIRSWPRPLATFIRVVAREHQFWDQNVNCVRIVKDVQQVNQLIIFQLYIIEISGQSIPNN